MRIPLDRQSPTPLYQQIETYLRENILSGQLVPKTRLPATRHLAQELGVSRITVNNAYAELQSAGLIDNREGSGAYVLDPPALMGQRSRQADRDWPLWQQTMLPGDAPPTDAPPRRGREPAKHPNPIAFTGVGDPREFPLKALERAIQTVLRRDGAAALAYGALDQGYAPLRATLTHVLASQGIRADPDQLLITAGSQQALALVCQLLLKPGDVILVESPTYNLALDLFRALELQIVGVPVDEQGMRVELLESLLQQHHPKLIYTIPNFQNPTGVCLSGARRRHLVALADRYNIPLLEDDFVGDLRYDGRAQPALKTLDPGGRVLYTGTFSKMLMPGLRVGFLLAEGPVLQQLVELKRVSDLTTSTLLQRALDDYVNVGQYQAHVRRSARLYRQRRDSMIAAIHQYLPSTVEFVPAQGGIFLWLRLPPGESCAALLPRAAAAGVEFAPGTRFFAKASDGESYIRLNFAALTPAEIEEGIRRLASAVSVGR